MKRTVRFLLEWLVYLIMAEVFLVLFGFISEAMIVGKIQFAWLTMTSQAWVMICIVNWVSGLIGLTLLLFEKVLADWVDHLAAQLDPDGDDDVGILTFLLDGGVVALTFSLLYFTTSPLLGWLLTYLAPPPHQGLFSFYVEAWSQFGWTGAWSLLIASAGVFFGYILLLVLWQQKKRHEESRLPPWVR